MYYEHTLTTAHVSLVDDGDRNQAQLASQALCPLGYTPSSPINLEIQPCLNILGSPLESEEVGLGPGGNQVISVPLVSPVGSDPLNWSPQSFKPVAKSTTLSSHLIPRVLQCP